MKYSLIILTTACLASAVPTMGTLGHLGSRLINIGPVKVVADDDCILKDDVSGATVITKPFVTVPQKVITVRPSQLGSIVSRVASLGQYTHLFADGKTMSLSDLVSSLHPSATIVREEVEVPKVYVHEKDVVAPTLIHRDESRVTVPNYYIREHKVVAPSALHNHHHVTTFYAEPEVYSTEHRVIVPSTSEHRVIVPSTSEHRVIVSSADPKVVSSHVMHEKNSILRDYESSVAVPVIASVAQPTVSIVGPSMNIYQTSTNAG